jgi:hypothetical protein
LGGAVVLATAALVLTACTPGLKMGVRLNADGTVDQVLCDYAESFEVDYRVKDSDVDGPEWEAAEPEERSETDLSIDDRVILYGELPRGAESPGEALPPPRGWTSVILSRGEFDRSELVEGEWVWSPGDLPWVPGRPCSGLELDAAGDPVE